MRLMDTVCGFAAIRGTVENLRPIVNRPAWADAKVARSRLTIGRRFSTVFNLSQWAYSPQSVMKTRFWRIMCFLALTPGFRPCPTSSAEILDIRRSEGEHED